MLLRGWVERIKHRPITTRGAPILCYRGNANVERSRGGLWCHLTCWSGYLMAACRLLFDGSLPYVSNGGLLFVSNAV